MWPRSAPAQVATALLLTFALTWTGVGAVAGFAEGVIRRHPVDVADNLAARRLETQARVLARAVNWIDAEPSSASSEASGGA